MDSLSGIFESVSFSASCNTHFLSSSHRGHAPVPLTLILISMLKIVPESNTVINVKYMRYAQHFMYFKEMKTLYTGKHRENYADSGKFTGCLLEFCIGRLVIADNYGIRNDNIGSRHGRPKEMQSWKRCIGPFQSQPSTS